MITTLLNMLMTLTMANTTTFHGEVISTKYCEKNKECIQAGNYLGDHCLATVTFTGQEYGLTSERNRNGSNSMFIGGQPLQNIDLEIGDQRFINYKAKSPYYLHKKDYAIMIKKRFRSASGSMLFTRDSNDQHLLEEVIFSTNKSDKNHFVFTCQF